MSRPRIYDFAALAVGDRIMVALNGCSPRVVQASVHNAAAHYRRTRDADFQFSTDAVSTPGFVALERLPEAGKVARLIAEDRARMARLDQLSRERSLTQAEQDRVYRTDLRLRRRAA